jgi:UDP-N-acetylglucosamine transferase subunit ALG13
LGIGAVIFASVGSVLPFDRFVRAIDDWAGAHPDQQVFIQIGEGKFEPTHAQWVRIMPHDEYRRRLAGCSLFVAHVGMGSILQGLEERKQMILLPRHRDLGEHTTDHQLHTASRFAGMPGLQIVDDVPSLQAAISASVAAPMQTEKALSPFASQELLNNVRGFLRPILEKRHKAILAAR